MGLVGEGKTMSLSTGQAEVQPRAPHRKTPASARRETSYAGNRRVRKGLTVSDPANGPRSSQRRIPTNWYAVLPLSTALKGSDRRATSLPWYSSETRNAVRHTATTRLSATRKGQPRSTEERIDPYLRVPVGSRRASRWRSSDHPNEETDRTRVRSSPWSYRAVRPPP